MKIKIKVKRFRNEENIPYVQFPRIIKKGDWIDLRSAEKVELAAPQANIRNKSTKLRNVTAEVTKIRLGVAMQLPPGYEAVIVPRSSCPAKMGILQANSMAVIDNSYCGDSDEWMFPAVPIRKTTIEPNTRICQFRIQLSQKATVWQKLKWLFSSGIKFEEVEKLDNEDRGGIGSTGYTD